MTQTVFVMLYGMLCYATGIIMGYCIQENKLASRILELETRQDPEKYNG